MNLPDPDPSTNHPWSNEVAARVKLLVPSTWLRRTSSSSSSSPFCHLRYDSTTKLLLIVPHREEPTPPDDDKGSTDVDLDRIDTDDLIGAHLEITMNPPPGSEKSARKPETELVDPAAFVWTDKLGSAVLNLYVYSRRRPSSAPRRFFSRFGSGLSLPPVPDPHYQRPSLPPGLDPREEGWGPRGPCHRQFVLAPAGDLQDANLLVQGLLYLATGRTPTRASVDTASTPPLRRPPRYLLLVNPFAGASHQAEKVANTVVRPLLEQSGVECEIRLSTHRGHATQLALVSSDPAQDMAQYDGLVVLGGDGTLQETLNGLCQRRDDVLKRIKVGTVGCGSSNGYAASICYQSQEVCAPLDETFLIAKGGTIQADLSRYQTRNHTYLSFLTFSWALIADVDIESECVRFLGPLRFDLWAVWRMLWLRRYRARFSYRPIDTTTSPPATEEMPDLASPVPADWKVVEDDFIVFWATQVTHPSQSTLLSPESTLSDAVFQIFILRGPLKKSQLLRNFMVLDDKGTLFRQKPQELEIITCTAYRLEPLTTGSFNVVDGEAVEAGPIQSQVLPRQLNLFGRHRPGATPPS